MRRPTRTSSVLTCRRSSGRIDLIGGVYLIVGDDLASQIGTSRLRHDDPVSQSFNGPRSLKALPAFTKGVLPPAIIATRRSLISSSDARCVEPGQIDDLTPRELSAHTWAELPRAIDTPFIYTAPWAAPAGSHANDANCLSIGVSAR